METVNEQKDISAAQDPAQPHPWISGPLPEQERQGGDSSPQGQGPHAAGGLGFPGAFRLIRRQSFLDCYDRGRRYHSKGFILFVLPHAPSLVHWRLGMAVSKKVGCAVVRNRVKRVLREFFRLRRQAIPGGIDIVAVPKRNLNAAALTLVFASAELDPLLERIREDAARFAPLAG